MWPATGLLFMALWTSPPRNWIWIVAVQILVQGSVYFAFADTANWRWDPVFAVANSLDGLVGALIAKRLVPSITTPHVGPILKFLGGDHGRVRHRRAGRRLRVDPHRRGHALRPPMAALVDGQLAGIAVHLPDAVVVGREAAPPPARRTGPRAADFALTAGALLGMTYWTFSSAPGVLTSIFQSPLLVLALAVVIAFRMPPRWATTLTALSVLMAVYYTSRHLGRIRCSPPRLPALRAFS